MSSTTTLDDFADGEPDGSDERNDERGRRDRVDVAERLPDGITVDDLEQKAREVDTRLEIANYLNIEYDRARSIIYDLGLQHHLVSNDELLRRAREALDIDVDDGRDFE